MINKFCELENISWTLKLLSFVLLITTCQSSNIFSKHFKFFLNFVQIYSNLNLF